MSIPKEQADWDLVKDEPDSFGSPDKLDKLFNEVIRLLRKIAGE